MIEIEQAKMLSFSLAAILSQFAGVSLGQVMPDGLDVWLERGGTGLCIVFLILAVRALRTERDERQKRLDAMHDREVEASATSAQSREKLSAALDKLTEAVNKK
jgi:hypothetical protein